MNGVLDGLRALQADVAAIRLITEEVKRFIMVSPPDEPSEGSCLYASIVRLK